MQFVNRTGTMIAERGPDDTSRKPPLAEAFRRNTVDPLSAIERIRGAFRAAGRIGSFMIPVYDGARRFDIVGRILPKQNPSNGALRAELTLRAIAGFKGETSEDGHPDDAPRQVELSVDEARMVPLSITVPVFSFAARRAVSASLRSARPLHLMKAPEADDCGRILRSAVFPNVTYLTPVRRLIEILSHAQDGRAGQTWSYLPTRVMRRCPHERGYSTSANFVGEIGK